MNTIGRAAVLAVVIAAAVSGCTSTSPAPPAAPRVAVSVAPPVAASVAPTGGSADHPVIGVAYPFEMFTHCGIRWADFGGRSWLAVHPTSAQFQPNETAGTMTLVSADAARFDYAGGAVEFTPATPRAPSCL
jgi:hypothetical protein